MIDTDKIVAASQISGFQNYFTLTVDTSVSSFTLPAFDVVAVETEVDTPREDTAVRWKFVPSPLLTAAIQVEGRVFFEISGYPDWRLVAYASFSAGVTILQYEFVSVVGTPTIVPAIEFQAEVRFFKAPFGEFI